MKPRRCLCRSALLPLILLLCLIGSATHVRASGKVVLWGFGPAPAWTNAVGIAAGESDARIEEELYLAERVLLTLESPDVIVDSIGLMVLSRRPPAGSP